MSRLEIVEMEVTSDAFRSEFFQGFFVLPNSISFGSSGAACS